METKTFPIRTIESIRGKRAEPIDLSCICNLAIAQLLPVFYSMLLRLSRWNSLVMQKTLEKNQTIQIDRRKSLQIINALPTTNYDECENNLLKKLIS